MKQIVLYVFLLFFLFEFETHAQKRFGIKAGYNNTFFRTGEDDDLGNIDAKNGFNIGGIWEVPLSQRASFETGLGFENKGVNYDPLGNVFSFGKKPEGYLQYDLLYFNLPLTLRFKWGEGLVKPTFAIGPYFSYLLSAKYKFTGDLTAMAETEYGDSDGVFEVGFEEEDDVFIPFDLGLSISFGIAIEDVRIELGYDRGYMDIQTMYEMDNYIKNDVYKISLSYMFGLY